MNYKNRTPVSTFNSVNVMERKALELAADGKYEIAAELFYKAAIEGELNNINPEHIIELWRDTANCYYSSFKFKDSIKYYEKALALAIKHDKKILEYRINLQIFLLLHAAGDYESSLDVLQKAYTIAEHLKRDEFLVGAKAYLGMYYCRIKDGDKALMYVNDAIRYFEGLGDTARIAGGYYNAGQAYVIKLDAINAEKCFRKALSYFIEVGRQEEVMRCKCMLGGVLEGYHMNGIGSNREEGIALLKEALELSIMNGHKYDEFGIRLMLGEVYIRDNNDLLAEKELLAAKKLAVIGGSQQNSLEYNKKLSEIEERRGNLLQSLHYLKQHIEVLEEEELNNQKQRKMIVEIQMIRMEERRKNELLENELRTKQQINDVVNFHVQENEKYLLRLSNQINEILNTTNGTLKKKLTALRKDVKNTIESKKVWTEFEQGILESQNDLIKKLSANFPSLTHTELKVCMLLQAGRSSKEIASLLHISPDTVDTHRINIRRKMGLGNRTSIRTVLGSI